MGIPIEIGLDTHGYSLYDTCPMTSKLELDAVGRQEVNIE
jgi:hypothetical protein